MKTFYRWRFVPHSILLFAAAAIGASSSLDRSGGLERSDILVIGDSQIAFGGGEQYIVFFRTLADRCGRILPDPEQDFAALVNLKVGVLGVRATALHSWVARIGPDKDQVCVPEASWPVNARGFGELENPKIRFSQIGANPAYPLCVAGRSPIEALFNTAGVMPELIVLSFLGRAVTRWAGSIELARKDASALAEQVPSTTPCVFITTAPTFSPAVNIKRRKAQQNFHDALAEKTMSCRAVNGLTTATIAKLEGTPEFFKRDGKGRVRDPFHPNGAGIAAFLETISPELCKAVSGAIMDASASRLATGAAE